MDIEEQYDKIYRFCYYRVRNRETAEDLTQETFLCIMNGRYEERGEKIRYLYTIARNLCIEESRRIKTEEIWDNVSDDIRMINSYILTLDSGKEITVPKTRYKQLRQEYARFVGRSI